MASTSARASTSDTKLTGYAVQLDKSKQAMLVTLDQDDVELAQPVAQVAMPARLTGRPPTS